MMLFLRTLCIGLFASFGAPLLLPANLSENSSDYATHLEELRKHIPVGFTVVVQHPFVVIGNEDPATVRRRSTNTVKWAVTRLKKDFFTHDPKEILDIWLFKDKESYQRHTRE